MLLPGSEGEAEPPLGEELLGEERPPDDEVPAGLRAAIELCERGEPVLLIAPSEAAALRHAEQALTLLAAAGPAPATAALAEIQRTASGRAHELLTQTLRYGVGLMAPGLLPQQRAALRTGLREGELRLLCAPLESVLDEDLRMRNVVVAAPQVLRRPERGGSPVRVPLGAGELQQLAGRCARATSFLGGSGRALFVAHDRMQAEDLKRSLWTPTPTPAARPTQPLLSTLRGQLLGERVLALLGAAPERDPRELLLLMQLGERLGSSPAGQRALQEAVNAALHELVDRGLVTEVGSPALTESGEVAVRHGLAARSAARLVRWAEAAHGAPWIDLEALLVVSLYPEAGPRALSEPLPLHPSELETQEHPIEALARVAAEGATERPLFRWLADRQTELTLDQIRAVKRALLLFDWAERHDGATLEARYGIWLGTLQRVAASAARELAALIEICAVRGWSQTALRRLRRLRERLARPLVPSSGPVERARTVIAIRAALRAGAVLGQAVAAEHVAPPLLRPKSS
jgi:replicative superfamily II helicase